jgi:Ca2+-binding RTX toxin-like protein
MSRRRRQIALVALTAAGLGAAAPALAGDGPFVTYDPPRITVKAVEMTAENLDVRKEGKRYVFTNNPSIGTADVECQAPGQIACRIRGITKIIVNLGPLGDTGQINLGSRARDVKQVMRGEDGGDILLGERGPQTLKGGDGGDTLQGGAGGDLLNGGPGVDNCLGGPGPDTLINCEG